MASEHEQEFILDLIELGTKKPTKRDFQLVLRVVFAELCSLSSTLLGQMICVPIYLLL